MLAFLATLIRSAHQDNMRQTTIIGTAIDCLAWSSSYMLLPPSCSLVSWRHLVRLTRLELSLHRRVGTHVPSSTGDYSTLLLHVVMFCIEVALGRCFHHCSSHYMAIRYFRYVSMPKFDGQVGTGEGKSMIVAAGWPKHQTPDTVALRGVPRHWPSMWWWPWRKKFMSWAS